MSFVVSIYRKPTYVHAAVTGEYDGQKVRDAYLRIVDAAHRHSLLKILIDCRRLMGDPPKDERIELARFGAAHRLELLMAGKASGYQVAVVAGPVTRPDRPGFREAVNRGVPFTLCDRIEQALAWLGVPAEDFG